MRSRIKELRYVKASELVADPRNYRRHPERQRRAMAAMLGRLGHVNAVVARETPEGLVLIDGHLRAGLDPSQSIPVLVVDLDERESGEALATLDPLGAMGETDDGAYESLLASIAQDSDGVLKGVLKDVADFELFTVPDHRVEMEDLEKQQAAQRKRLMGEDSALRNSKVICPQCGHEFEMVPDA